MDSRSDWLMTAKLVRVGVPDSGGDPWIEGFGRSADDPDFPALLEEIRAVRSADDGN
jgi:hypothetical protein